jgi:hypothetical protein
MNFKQQLEEEDMPVFKVYGKQECFYDMIYKWYYIYEILML